MKNKLLFTSLTIGAGLVIGSCFYKHGVETVDTAASSNECISYTNYSVKNYLTSEYGKIISYSENTSNKFLINNVKNFSQSDLNDYYNSIKNDGTSNDITGTCTIVGCLGMVYYFGNNLNEYVVEYYEDMFVKIYDNCLNAGYTTRQSGTSKTKVNNCLSKAFDTYYSNRSGNTEWYYLYKKLNKFIREENTPVLFDLTNHTVVACGFTTYDFSYEETYTTGSLWWKEEKTRTVSTSEEFIIVNEGWGRYSKSLVSTNRITNIYDGMQICFAEEN